MTCGDAETSGSIFASAIDLAFTLLATELKERRTIPPVLMFMDQSSGAFPVLQKLADLQPSNAMPSFNVLPLGDLLRLFQGHEATDQRDKIYALLGLSSDNMISPELRPDYTKGWSTLFRQVIEHVLGPSSLLRTFENTEQAIIFETGSVLGQIAVGFHNTLHVNSPVFGELASGGYHWRASWAVPHHCNSVTDGDLLVFFKNARRPSIIRPCGDHFDIVMISLPPPSNVTIGMRPPSTTWQDLNITWKDFSQGARRSKRYFNLVWDWADSKHNAAAHTELLNNCQSPSSSSIERRFNTARVLDDLLDHSALRSLLQGRPAACDFGEMEKHLVLLEHVSVHWEEYARMKKYFNTLKWGLWFLEAPVNVDPLLEFLHSEGPLAPDLFDIVKFSEEYSTKAESLRTGYHDCCWDVEPWQYTLYPLIFPSYARPMAPKGRNVIGAISPNGCRHLTRLVVASQPRAIEPTYNTLERACKSAYLDTFVYIIFVALTEQGSPVIYSPELWDLGMRNLPYSFHSGHLSFLFSEFSYSSVATWSFLEYVLTAMRHDGPIQRLWTDVLLANRAVLSRHLDNDALCAMEMDMWINQPTSFESVLRYLIQSMEPYYMFGYNDRKVSLHHVAIMFSVEALTRWAHQVLLDTFERYDRRNRRSSFSSDDSFNSVSTASGDSSVWG